MTFIKIYVKDILCIMFNDDLILIPYYIQNLGKIGAFDHIKCSIYFHGDTQGSLDLNTGNRKGIFVYILYTKTYIQRY